MKKYSNVATTKVDKIKPSQALKKGTLKFPKLNYTENWENMKVRTKENITELT